MMTSNCCNVMQLGEKHKELWEELHVLSDTVGWIVAALPHTKVAKQFEFSFTSMMQICNDYPLTKQNHKRKPCFTMTEFAS